MSPDGLESTPLVDHGRSNAKSVKSNGTAFICGHPNDPIPIRGVQMGHPI
jgi:hypothetical protein